MVRFLFCAKIWHIGFLAIDAELSCISTPNVIPMTKLSSTFPGYLTIVDLEKKLILRKAHNRHRPTDFQLVRKYRRILDDWHRGQDYLESWLSEYFATICIPVATPSSRDSNRRRCDRTMLIGFIKAALLARRLLLVMKFKKEDRVSKTSTGGGATGGKGKGGMSEAMKFMRTATNSGSTSSAYRWLIKKGMLWGAN